VTSQPRDDYAAHVYDDAVEQFVSEGNLKAALDYLDGAQGRSSEPHALLWLANERAKVCALSGESKKAEAHLAEAQELIASGVPASPRLTIGLLNTQGVILLNRQSWQEADIAFEQAERHAALHGSDWQRAAILINRACVAIANRDSNRALDLLDEAHSASVKSTVSQGWKAARQVSIETNRASALLAQDDIDEGIAALVRAREAAATLGDQLLSARQDYNLATIYRRQGRHKSALDASMASYNGYLSGGATEESKRAGVSIVKALADLGRYRAADRAAEELMAGRPWDSVGLSDEEWRVELQNVYIGVCRHTGRTALADRLEILRMAVSDSGQSVNSLFNLIGSALVNAFNAMIDNRVFEVPKRIIDREYAKILPNNALGRSSREVLDVCRDFLLNGTWDMERLLQHRSIFLKSDIAFDELVDLAYFSMAYARNDADEVLRVCLRALHRHQVQISKFETSEGRSRAHLSRADSDITLVLNAVSATENWSAQFEVLEFLRRESAKRKDITEDALLKPYASLPYGEGGNSADSAYAAELLEPSAPYRVRGASAISEAATVAASEVDADDVRQIIGGRDATWLTSFYWNGMLYWAGLDEGSASGGFEVLDESWHSAWQAHRRLLPLATPADAACLGDSVPRWCVDLVALARASRGGLIDSDSWFEACIDALPARYQTAVRRYASEIAEMDVWGVYSRLARHVIPAPLAKRLSEAASESRLLLSPAVELATLPFELLPIGDNGKCLVELATCQVIPPNFLATAIAKRPYSVGPYELGLLVSNPTSDLRSPPAKSLASVPGFGSAVNKPVTRSRLLYLLDQLDDASAINQVFSYIGHIRPGSMDSPDSAALVLASDTASAENSYLSAADLLRSMTAVPARVYLGGCEGAGFDTGVEWGSVASALIARGASTVIAHAWPVLDDKQAEVIDQECVAALCEPAGFSLNHLRKNQIAWLNAWRHGDSSALPPYYWSGIQYIGR